MYGVGVDAMRAELEIHNLCSAYERCFRGAVGREVRERDGCEDGNNLYELVSSSTRCKLQLNLKE